MNELIVKVENKDGKLVVGSRVIAEQLGKRHADVIKQLEVILTNKDVHSLIIESNYLDLKGESRKEYLLTEKGLGIYLNKIKLLKDKIPDFLLEFADMTQFHTHTRFELSFLDMLEESLIEINITGVRQYVVDNYRIDFYIESLNLAIEYDEGYHYSRADEDSRRQMYLTNKLRCRFIRCNYKDSDIKNVMKILKFIIKGEI